MKRFLKYFLILGLSYSCAAMTPEKEAMQDQDAIINSDVIQREEQQVFGDISTELWDQKPWWGKIPSGIPMTLWGMAWVAAAGVDIAKKISIYPLGGPYALVVAFMGLTYVGLTYASQEGKQLEAINAVEHLLEHSKFGNLKFAATEQDALQFTQQFKHIPIYSAWVYLEKFHQKMNVVRQQLLKIEDEKIREKSQKLHEIINSMVVGIRAYQEYLSKHQDFKMQEITYQKAIEENKVRDHVQQIECNLR